MNANRDVALLKVRFAISLEFNKFALTLLMGKMSALSEIR
jgi:hypothetical protein